MGLSDTFITIGIILFIVLLIWSRVMNQTMLDTLLEIKEFLKQIADNE